MGDSLPSFNQLHLYRYQPTIVLHQKMNSQKNYLIIFLLITVVFSLLATPSDAAAHKYRRRNSAMKKRLSRVCSASCIRSTTSFSYVNSCSDFSRPTVCIYCRFVLKCTQGNTFIW